MSKKRGFGLLWVRFIIFWLELTENILLCLYKNQVLFCREQAGRCYAEEIYVLKVLHMTECN